MIATRNGAIGIPGEYMWAIRSILDTKENADLYDKLSAGKEMLSLWGLVTTFFEGAFENHMEYYYLEDKDIVGLKEAIGLSLQHENLKANQYLRLSEAIRYLSSN